MPKTKHVPTSLEHRLDLISRAKDGDSAALEEYDRINAGLTRNIIKQYKKWMSDDALNDLRQEAFLGLVEGIEHYKTSKTKSDAPPESYIFMWVRAYVGNYAKAHGMGGKEQAVGAAQESVTEDTCAADSMERLLIVPDATPATDDRYYNHEVDYWLANIVDELLPKERVVYRRRCVADVPETLEEIGADMGLSRERVRQIEMDVADKLKKKALRDLPNMSEAISKRECLIPGGVHSSQEYKIGQKKQRQVRAVNAVKKRRKHGQAETIS